MEPPNLWAGVPTPQAFFAIAIAGVLSHRFYFIRGEKHMKAPVYAISWVFISTCIVFAGYIINAWNRRHTTNSVIASPVGTCILINVAFFTPLFISMLIYRTFEHALREFPGPRLAAVSKLWHFYHMLVTENHLLLEDIRNEYGPFVRTGPQELTVFHPDILDAISKHGTTCIKAPAYDMLHPFSSLNSIRTKLGYQTRRKRWDEAFGFAPSHVPDKEGRIQYFASLLVNRIFASAGEPINVTTWAYHFAFDIILDISFKHSSDLTKNLQPATKLHDLPALISHGVSMLRYFTPAPWMGRLCVEAAPYIPMIPQNWNRALNWAAEMCDKRIERSNDVMDTGIGEPADAFSRFIFFARRDQDDDLLNRLALYGDASVIIAAGSHTTAATLTMLIYELSQSQQLQAAAREEVIGILATSTMGRDETIKEKIDISTWSNFPFLNGCINEVLRLYPPIVSGGIRQTVDKPIMVGGRWIPPDTIIVAPRWSIGRLESAYERPNEFIPERWTTKPEMVKNANAFSPFAKGRHICPGKQLGLLEVRMAAAMILVNFKFRLAATKRNQTRVIDDMQDGFTASLGDLEIIFKPIN
ncbi:hypothetical protein K445DRAFT_7823 [Daldinia sp. EC12]|nr:hypothetical protein K445DRAFT_7823 [Daldinia sp. EC12]